MSECPTCEGAGRLPVGEYGGDCAAIHGMGGRMPDPPGWERCDACAGSGQVDEEDASQARTCGQCGAIDFATAMVVCKRPAHGDCQGSRLWPDGDEKATGSAS